MLKLLRFRTAFSHRFFAFVSIGTLGAAVGCSKPTDPASTDSSGDVDLETAGDTSAASSGSASKDEDDSTSANTTDDTKTTGGSDESTTSDEIDFPNKFDLDDDVTFSGEGEQGCAKIDFLFIVDNSLSMEDEQKNLINSFPGFLDGIRETLQAKDYRILVADSDINSNGGNQVCTDKECTCSPAPDCCLAVCSGGNSSCNGKSCPDWNSELACLGQFGTGRTTTPTGDSCDIADEKRFITQDQDDLDGTFACLAQVGINGNGLEKMMSSMLGALDGARDGEGGCNEGFLRDDAFLVVTLITDEEEKAMLGSPGAPQEWYDQLVQFKGGDEKAIVMIGFVGDIGQPGQICKELDQTGNQTDGAENSPRLLEFVGMFGSNGLAASICADDYGPSFQQAVEVIDGACQTWDPK